MATTVEMKIDESSIRVMKPEIFAKTGSIAVADIHIVVDNTTVAVLKNNWLKEVTFKGNTQLELMPTTYPSSSNKLNPKTNKPYNDVPFTLFPKTTKSGSFGSYSDSNHAAYKNLCKTLYDKAVSLGFQKTANSSTSTNTTRVAF